MIASGVFRSFDPFVCLVSVGALVSCVTASMTVGAETGRLVAGEWALTSEAGVPGWLAVVPEGKEGSVSFLWGTGTVLSTPEVQVEHEQVRAVHERPDVRRDAAGVVQWEGVARTTLHIQPAKDGVRVERTFERVGFSPPERAVASGTRMPPLPARPTIDSRRFGPAIDLLANDTLSGWQLVRSEARNGWNLVDGVLTARPELDRRNQYGDLRTTRTFEDFELSLEVRVPPGGNSGVYLRGLYEVQVADSAHLTPGTHTMGAIYGRIAPHESAERSAGEWQEMVITLWDRHVTVILNGRTIIERAPLSGITGGALSADVLAPGPIVLQGDHGPIEYRAIRLRPRVQR